MNDEQTMKLELFRIIMQQSTAVPELAAEEANKAYDTLTTKKEAT
jgi:hypothetical protein